MKGKLHSPEGPNSACDIRDIFPNFIGGLQAEQIEVAQQVVVEGQELQVQLWQGQAVLACMQTMPELSPHTKCWIVTIPEGRHEIWVALSGLCPLLLRMIEHTVEELAKHNCSACYIRCRSGKTS